MRALPSSTRIAGTAAVWYVDRASGDPTRTARNRFSAAAAVRESGARAAIIAPRCAAAACTGRRAADAGRERRNNSESAGAHACGTVRARRATDEPTERLTWLSPART
ncbi:unnamed protein product [Macrosiphum euphorbiae]|uniref:Uncharacterized protein n=1 Tax=Macrosiphum euphorbiae TaxID=13131 RepID=A0AAV0VNY3_9HEMI|nr:unnamed protein product [Macrosiphum euphorbiae]